MFMVFFFFKQKTAYEVRISDWSSDVCSSDLIDVGGMEIAHPRRPRSTGDHVGVQRQHPARVAAVAASDHAIVDAARRGIAVRRDRPTDHRAIKARRAVGVARYQFVPDETALGIGHRLSPSGGGGSRIWRDVRCPSPGKGG